MGEKLATRAIVDARSILPARSKARTHRFAQKEQLLSRYQITFKHNIEGVQPLEKFNLQKFTMYDGK